MFLTAPKRGQAVKPNRSQKGAFTNKAAPKIQKWKPPEEEGYAEAAPPPPPKVETPFVRWLKEKKTNGSWHVEEAKDFLLEGPPYKGDSAWGTKDMLIDMGTAWQRNPLKKNDCDDKTIKRGWSCAPDESTMLKLLRATTEKGGGGGRGRCRAWWCCGLTDTQLTQVEKWLVEFLGDQCDEDRPESEAPARKRAKGEGADDSWKGVPQWIIDANAKYVHRWVPDTVCVKCSQAVTDQFMDCSCQEARWQRCAVCLEKWRTDLTDSFEKMANPNAWCKCPRQSSLGHRWTRDSPV